MSRREPYNFDKPQDGAKVFWKSLEEKNDPEAARKRAEAEFPLGFDEARMTEAKLVQLRKNKKDEERVSLGRRGFMFFAGASAALALEGCARRPLEKIMPYSKAPEHVLPGVTSYYASVRQVRGEAIGVLVESHEGHPTKVEGNPIHSASHGATDAFTQASIYDLYDPDRSQTPMKGNRTPSGGYSSHAPASWSDVDQQLADIVRQSSADNGARLRILMEPSISPTMLRLREALMQKLPQAKVHVWTPVHDGNPREGAKIAFGQVLNVLASFSQAKVILSLDSDFLGTESGNVRNNREFIDGRRIADTNANMSRLYVVEPSFTITGMNADHRLRLPAQDIERYLLALAKQLGASGVDLGPIAAVAAKADTKDIPEQWLKVVAKELAGARAKSVIVAGSRQPARVHALVHALNGALGNAGHTVNYFAPADALDVDPGVSLKQLTDAMAANQVGTLVILGGNPVYDAPSDLKFGEKLRNVTNTIHLSVHFNETSEQCGWHIPRAHELEAWGDQRSLDGTIAIQQPLIAPLFNGRSDIEVMARIGGDSAPKGFNLVQATVRGSLASASNFTRLWNEALKKGVLGPSARAFGTLDARATEVSAAFDKVNAPSALGPQNLEVTFGPCPRLFDGRYANNPLLLELPDPITKMTWDNVALVSPGTARALNVESGHIVRLTREGAGPVDIAVWVTPGQADNSLTLHLGWGRQKAGRYGNKHGFDVTPLRTSTDPWITSGVKAALLNDGELDQIKDRFRKVGMAAGESPMAGRIRPDDPYEVDTKKYKLSQTQEHQSMEGRPVAIDATLAEYKKNPSFIAYPNEDRKDINQKGEVIGVRGSGSPDPEVGPLWGDWKQDSFFKGQHRWGMGIDLTACTGCNACVIACMVENNVPAVGKEQVWRGREMHWLRIDRYFIGTDENKPEVVQQPVACVQCEEAPCENVCPVNATEHSPEGLNDMAYNRCIGTRYCANNCPYKVRRFNFLNYHTSGGYYDELPEIERMRYNPNVTVRMRGVMEKCNYCVQRIQEAKIKSKRENRPISDVERPGAVHLTTACAQVCPTNAIVFGDLADPATKVAKWRARDRAYRLLAELGTRPRTTYLGKIRNPNAEMEGA